MNLRQIIVAALLMVVPLAACSAVAKQNKETTKNLLPDPVFAKSAQIATHPPKGVDGLELRRIEPWSMFEIELPSTVTYGKGSATLTGGRTFLHSSAFDVEPGKTYNISFKTSGDGKVSAGFLWWQAYDLDKRIEMANPHWTKMQEPADTTEKAQRIKAQFTAPADSHRAYLRLEITEGTVTVSNVKVLKSKVE